MPAQPAVRFVGRAKTWSEAKLQCNKTLSQKSHVSHGWLSETTNTALLAPGQHTAPPRKLV